MRVKTVVTPLICIALAVALVAGLNPQGPPEAAAEVKRHKTYSGSSGQDVSKAKFDQLKALQKMFNHAWPKNGAKVLDYARVDRDDGGHTTWRREMAAGWIMAGGALKNISKSERKEVYAKIPGPNRCQVCAARVVKPTGDDWGTKGCTGRNDKSITAKPKPRPPVTWVQADLYFNSCETDLVIRNLNQTALAFGIIAAACGMTLALVDAGAVLGIVAGILALGANEIDYRQKRSSKDAVWVRVRYSLYIQLRSQ